MARRRADPRCREIKADIIGSMARVGVKVPELAKRTGIPYSTLSARLRSDDGIGSLKLSELWAIRDVLGM